MEEQACCLGMEASEEILVITHKRCDWLQALTSFCEIGTVEVTLSLSAMIFGDNSIERLKYKVSHTARILTRLEAGKIMESRRKMQECFTAISAL